MPLCVAAQLRPSCARLRAQTWPPWPGPRRRVPLAMAMDAGQIGVLRVGLTGGIGSGKSEVSRRLAAHGAVIIDGDLGRPAWSSTRAPSGWRGSPKPSAPT